MKRRLSLGVLAGVASALLVLGSASALVIERGNGDEIVPIEPIVESTSGADGDLNDAHGPFCDFGEAASTVLNADIGDCPNNQAAPPGPDGDSETPLEPGGMVNPFGTTLGAWNGFFQSCVNSGGESAVVGAEEATGCAP